MTINRFKTRLFWFLIGSKLLLVVYTYLFLKSGMTPGEFYASLALMLPLLGAYLIPLWKEVVSQPQEKSSSQIDHSPKLKKQFVQVCYIAFPLYVLVVGIVLTNFVTGDLFTSGTGTFEDVYTDRTGTLAAALSAVETLFGLYLGPVITAVTRNRGQIQQKALKYAATGQLDKALATLDPLNDTWKEMGNQFATQKLAYEADEITKRELTQTEHRIYQALFTKLV